MVDLFFLVASWGWVLYEPRPSYGITLVFWQFIIIHLLGEGSTGRLMSEMDGSGMNGSLAIGWVR